MWPYFVRYSHPHTLFLRMRMTNTMGMKSFDSSSRRCAFQCVRVYVWNVRVHYSEGCFLVALAKAYTGIDCETVYLVLFRCICCCAFPHAINDVWYCCCDWDNMRMCARHSSARTSAMELYRNCWIGTQCFVRCVWHDVCMWQKSLQPRNLYSAFSQRRIHLNIQRFVWKYSLAISK